jgi:hypothetical protein
MDIQKQINKIVCLALLTSTMGVINSAPASAGDEKTYLVGLACGPNKIHGLLRASILRWLLVVKPHFKCSKGLAIA